MNERNEGQAARRPYHKPQLEEVQLVAEEAVLMNCKGTASAGKNSVGCKPTTAACKKSFGS
jgi:hypothetical protein